MPHHIIFLHSYWRTNQTFTRVVKIAKIKTALFVMTCLPYMILAKYLRHSLSQMFFHDCSSYKLMIQTIHENDITPNEWCILRCHSPFPLINFSRVAEKTRLFYYNIDVGVTHLFLRLMFWFPAWSKRLRFCDHQQWLHSVPSGLPTYRKILFYLQGNVNVQGCVFMGGIHGTVVACWTTG